MPLLDTLISPVSALLDRIIPDKAQRDAAKLQLLQMQGTQELQTLQTQLSAIVAEANATDPWTSRARPSFLYVMYVIILCAIPMGVLSAFRPDMAKAISTGMNAYLEGIPEPLYTLFGTGYLGYTAARQWGKAKGTDK
ncbi:holin family protein [Novosphingobium terrae]|uniref:holin family protein n=1 Tax=Novosphingobium terrae TaxID=2726189 RepID=UPI001980810A|nr:holin family protein [Novosphingobium terrae]